MRNRMPKHILHTETGIINLDDFNNEGTHWVAYKKCGRNVIYFDSFGNLKPPKEVIKYFDNSIIKYNYDKFQSFNTVNCGHLCLYFLYNNNFC